MTTLDRVIRSLHEPRRRAEASWQMDIETFPDGARRQIGTVFLVNGACPLACLYCGLYRNMNARPATGEEIAAQIDAARQAMPKAEGLKLYNASSLFEPASIRQSADDLSSIARSLGGLDLVVVEARAENAHRARELAARISGQLEVAIGLEVADDRTLALLNKPTTVGRYRLAARLLTNAGIHLRSFVLVGLPFVGASESRRLALATFELARECGSRVISLLPVVATHEPMRRLEERGFFSRPSLSDFFDVVSACVGRGPVVLAETSSLDELPACPNCREATTESLRSLNERGHLLPVVCGAHEPPAAPFRSSAGTVDEVMAALA